MNGAAAMMRHPSRVEEAIAERLFAADVRRRRGGGEVTPVGSAGVELALMGSSGDDDDE